MTLSDSAEYLECLKSCEASCKANDLESTVSVMGLSWGLISPEVLKLEGNLDVILGSDCFYDPIVFENILVTVSYLLECNPSAKFIFSYQERSSDWSIEYLLHKWNLKCRILVLESFDADRCYIAGSSLPGSHKILVFEITLN